MIEVAEKAFNAARTRLRECRKQMYALNSMDDDAPEDFVDQERAAFAAALRQLYSTLVFVFEALQLPKSLDAFIAEFKQFEATLTSIDHFEGEHEYPYSPALDFLEARVVLIRPMLTVPDDTAAERRVVGRILRQSAKLVANLPPAKEKDLHDALEKVLKLGFPDCIRNPSIPKPTKTFKPDFGIESIRTAIEVKYVNSEHDKAAVLGELYEDMKGYTGAPEWTAFEALIYQTAPFLTQDLVDAEAKKVQVPKNWKIYLVTGHGT